MQTDIVRITEREATSGHPDLVRAGKLLRRGELVVFPTETVYGLGADATDADAARRIYAAKGRPSDNPLIVHIAAPEEAEKYAYINENFYRLAEAFWPGPLTLILPVKNSIPRTVTAGLSTVALRCPSHPVARALLREAGIPIAAPSANISGSPSPTCARHVIEDMNGRVSMIIDGGESEIGVESTIVQCNQDGSLTLLRPGGVTPDMLVAVCPELHVAEAVLGELPEGAVALSPGMKYRHYAPTAPLMLLKGNAASRRAFLEREVGRIAVICYEEETEFFREFLPSDAVFPFGRQDDLSRQSHLLFMLLRDIDKENFDKIFAPLPPTEGLGMALYNRMIRAAAHHIIDTEEKEV